MASEARWWITTFIAGAFLLFLLMSFHNIPATMNVSVMNSRPANATQTTQPTININNNNNLSPGSKKRFHFVFGTDCIAYKSSWQSLAVIHSFLRTQRDGSRITELIACKDKNYKPKHWLPAIHSAPTVNYFITTFSNPHPVSGDDYIVYNKPIAFREWLEKSPDRPEPDDVVVILDHDMILLQPFPEDLLEVAPRTAYGGFYALGYDWPVHNEHYSGICGPKCAALSHDERFNLQVGPPLVMRAKDLLDVSYGWYDYTVKCRDNEHIKGWTSEMYGYLIASVNIGLKHKIRHELMVSSTEVNEEWKPGMPHLVLHYCQSYSVGSWKWSKHDYHDFDPLTCDGKNFDVPPLVLDAPKSDKPQSTRAVWMAYTAVTWLNDAFQTYRQYACD